MNEIVINAPRNHQIDVIGGKNLLPDTILMRRMRTISRWNGCTITLPLRDLRRRRLRLYSIPFRQNVILRNWWKRGSPIKNSTMPLPSPLPPYAGASFWHYQQSRLLRWLLPSPRPTTQEKLHNYTQNTHQQNQIRKEQPMIISILYEKWWFQLPSIGEIHLINLFFFCACFSFSEDQFVIWCYYRWVTWLFNQRFSCIIIKSKLMRHQNTVARGKGGDFFKFIFNYFLVIEDVYFIT